MTNPNDTRPSPEGRAAFRRTLARVLFVQVVTLLALWFLQARFHA